MDEEVYHALNGIFKGQTAKKTKAAIRKIVSQHDQDEQVKALLHSHTLKDVCDSAQSLLADQIFGSEKKAQARFAKAAGSLSETPIVTVVPSAAAAAGNKQPMVLRDRVNTGKDGTQQCMVEAGENRGIPLQDVGVADINSRTTPNSVEAGQEMLGRHGCTSQRFTTAQALKSHAEHKLRGAIPPVGLYTRSPGERVLRLCSGLRPKHIAQKCMGLPRGD